MKKLLLLSISILLTLSLYSQKNSSAVVMYFKADLACCPARACASLEKDVQSVIESNFKNSQVVFKAVKLSDAENAEIVKKFNAKSQSVVIVIKNKKKMTNVDATSIVAEYSRNRNKETLEKELVKLINDNLK